MKKRKQPVRKTTLYLRNVDRDLKDRFKAWCALRSRSMTEVLEQLMRWRMKADKIDKTTDLEEQQGVIAILGEDSKATRRIAR